ncbi:hypothetical protein ROZALSC1DRAFT_29406 [Rozella allomycis CSF55]|uniref:Uncharacterized protein n=1 Tax=Rozella allomycis (strain CSF55) TaxID=988480 RepID=A0A4P9YHZ9_ROZAC|nr:hypothetical protein ROZALSC1DRAFT_29406 [Rozella allomycis CSF55]
MTILIAVTCIGVASKNDTLVQDHFDFDDHKEIPKLSTMTDLNYDLAGANRKGLYQSSDGRKWIVKFMKEEDVWLEKLAEIALRTLTKSGRANAKTTLEYVPHYVEEKAVEDNVYSVEGAVLIQPFIDAEPDSFRLIYESGITSDQTMTILPDLHAQNFIIRKRDQSVIPIDFLNSIFYRVRLGRAKDDDFVKPFSHSPSPNFVVGKKKHPLLHQLVRNKRIKYGKDVEIAVIEALSAIQAFDVDSFCENKEFSIALTSEAERELVKTLLKSRKRYYGDVYVARYKIAFNEIYGKLN